MLLLDLMATAGLRADGIDPARNSDVRHIRNDSRIVSPGDVFVAVQGTVADGHEYLNQAVARGAIAVVVERLPATPLEVPALLVSSSRAALADLAAALHGFPARRMRVTGITGTDGKTTSAFLLCHVLDSMGIRAGLLSTVAFKFGHTWEHNTMRQSTLDAPEVQGALARMLNEGVSDAIVESTSHGLALDRVRHCAFDDAIITNITSEHLEFHQTRARYIAAKAKLLDEVAANYWKPWPKLAAINIDDGGSGSLIPGSPVPVVSYGLSAEAVVRATDITLNAGGSNFTVQTERCSINVSTRLPGKFNIYNCLGVLALMHGRGGDLDEVARHVATFDGVAGRMKRVDAGQSFDVIVDYAHTAASLEKVLMTLRPLTRGALICVFGSAGDRDREKRPVMGAVSAKLADYSILTDEDPRGESSRAILDEIATGARAAGGVEGSTFEIVPDRREAIARAIARARPGDVVLLAGKGHEQSLIGPDGPQPWDEETAARDALAAAGFTP